MEVDEVVVEEVSARWSFVTRDKGKLKGGQMCFICEEKLEGMLDGIHIESLLENTLNIINQ